jgi:hypothetical protein
LLQVPSYKYQELSFIKVQKLILEDLHSHPSAHNWYCADPDLNEKWEVIGCPLWRRRFQSISIKTTTGSSVSEVGRYFSQITAFSWSRNISCLRLWLKEDDDVDAEDLSWGKDMNTIFCQNEGTDKLLERAKYKRDSQSIGWTLLHEMREVERLSILNRISQLAAPKREGISDTIRTLRKSSRLDGSSSKSCSAPVESSVRSCNRASGLKVKRHALKITENES